MILGKNMERRSVIIISFYKMQNKQEIKKIAFQITFLILFLFLLNFLYQSFNRNFNIIWNNPQLTSIPQEKFIEIRNIKYGMPTPEMREAQKAGEIILGGDSCFWCSKYAILIKN